MANACQKFLSELKRWKKRLSMRKLNNSHFTTKKKVGSKFDHITVFFQMKAITTKIRMLPFQLRRDFQTSPWHLWKLLQLWTSIKRTRKTPTKKLQWWKTNLKTREMQNGKSHWTKMQLWMQHSISLLYCQTRIDTFAVYLLVWSLWVCQKSETNLTLASLKFRPAFWDFRPLPQSKSL